MDISRVSVKESALLLGLEKRLLEAWLRTGKCPFGEYIRENGSMRGTYYISAERLNVYLSAADMFKCPYAYKGIQPDL